MSPGGNKKTGDGNSDNNSTDYKGPKVAPDRGLPGAPSIPIERIPRLPGGPARAPRPKQLPSKKAKPPTGKR